MIYILLVRYTIITKGQISLYVFPSLITYLLRIPKQTTLNAVYIFIRASGVLFLFHIFKCLKPVYCRTRSFNFNNVLSVFLYVRHFN